MVRDGIASADVAIQGSWNFAAAWDAWVDPESPIVQYEWCIGSEVGNEDVMPCTAVVRLRGCSTHDTHVVSRTRASCLNPHRMVSTCGHSRRRLTPSTEFASRSCTSP